MVSRFADEQGWRALATFLPEELELWCVEMGVIKRKRQIQDMETLLRLIMVHASGYSLRETASWAREKGIATLSDVALLKRFRTLPDLLSRVVQSLLPAPGGMGLCLVDATTVSRQIAKGTDFRVHLGWDAEGLQVAQVRLTDAAVGETLQSLPWHHGEILVGDRIYASRSGIAKVVETGGHVIVRMSITSTPLRDPNQERINLLELARPLKVGQYFDVDVETIPDKRKGIVSIPGRLLVVRKEPEAAERERKKATRESIKKGHQIRYETGESAEYTFIFTTLNRAAVDAETILKAYRHRWQIEMYFKRAKGIVGLGETLARDHELTRAVILAKLISMLLIDRLRSDFSPWGYGIPRRDQSLAIL